MKKKKSPLEDLQEVDCKARQSLNPSIVKHSVTDSRGEKTQTKKTPSAKTPSACSTKATKQANSSKKGKRAPEAKKCNLAEIVRISLAEPLLAGNVEAFVELIAKEFGISLSQARRDVEEVQTVMRALACVDYKKTISQKLLEYAHIKELALKQNNLNAYLGAVKAEAELLGLKKLSFFSKDEEEGEALAELEEKKRAFLEKILGE